jgi:putative membrane protein
MIYENYYWGMNLVWWIIWVVLIVWIFVVPFDVPGQRRRKDTPLDILQQRFAAGQFTTQEYKEKKAILENDLIKPK